MKSQDELAKDFNRGAETGQASNMFIGEDAIYSYGHHFPVAYRVNGRLFLFNEGKYSSSTSCQQTKVKRNLTGSIHETDTETVKKAIRLGVDSMEELREKLVIEEL